MESLMMDNARARFFPGWWLAPKYHTPEDELRTIYRVECKSFDEYRLAILSKPPNIDAKIVFEPDTDEIDKTG